MTDLLYIVVAVILGGFAVYFVLGGDGNAKPRTTGVTKNTNGPDAATEKKREEPKADVDALSAPSAAAPTKKNRSKKKLTRSKLLVHNVASHSKRATATAVSSDGALLAIANADSRVYVFQRKSLGERSPRYHMIKEDVDRSHPITALSFRSDGNVLMCALADRSRTLRFYTIPKLKRSKEKQKSFPELLREFSTNHDGVVVSSVFASTGKRPYVVTSSSGRRDTFVKVFTVKGAPIANIDTKLIRNVHVSVSADSDWIAVANETSEIKMLRVERDRKTGQVLKVSKKGSLTGGHDSGAVAVKFGLFPKGAYRAVSGSDDGVICLWDTDIRFDVGQNPIRLMRLRLTRSGVANLNVRCVALSPDTRTVAAVFTTSTPTDEALLCYLDISEFKAMKEKESRTVDIATADGGVTIVELPSKVDLSDQEDLLGHWTLEFNLSGDSVFVGVPGARNAQIWRVPA